MLAVVLLAASSAAHAVTTVWSGPSAGGSFHDPANWTNGVPGVNADDLAVFNATRNVDGAVTFANGVELGATYFQNTAGTLELDVGAGNVYQLAGNMIVGTAAGHRNDIVLSSGEVAVAILHAGNASGADHNKLTVTGAGTKLTAAGPTAAIRIGSNGGDHTQLLVTHGGAVESLTQFILGLQSASNNTVTVTGVGSSLAVAHSFSIGDNIAAGLPAQTNNRLEVLDGGFVTVRELIVGTTENSPDNTVLVSGVGSRLNVRGGQQAAPSSGIGQQNDVGRASSNNRLLVENGGVVDGGAIFFLGRFETSTDNLIAVTSGGSLTGAGVRINHGTLLIDHGDVTLFRAYDTERTPAIVLGGVFRIDQPNAVVDFRSGSLTSVSAIVTNGRQFVVGDGGDTEAVYRMTRDTLGALPRGPGADTMTHTFAGGFHLNANGVLEGDGDIVANVTGVSGARVRVGSSFGVINVAGQWNNRRITIELELGDMTGSPVAGEHYDLLNVTGSFVHGTGSAIVLDTTHFAPADVASMVRVIGWTGQVSSEVGSVVTYTGPWRPDYEFRADGLYVSTVPEPSVGLLVLTVFAMFRRSRP